MIHKIKSTLGDTSPRSYGIFKIQLLIVYSVSEYKKFMNNLSKTTLSLTVKHVYVSFSTALSNKSKMLC